MEDKSNFNFIVHPNDVCIRILKSADNLPLSKLRTWYSLTRTPTEFSLVCDQSAYDALPPSELLLDDAVPERDRVAFGIDGVLEMSMTGVLAGIAECLAEAQVPIFVVSTYNTDWILVSRDKFACARAVLEGMGHKFVDLMLSF